MATYANGRLQSELTQEKILRELEKLNATSGNTAQTSDNKGVSDNCPHTFGDKIFIVHGHDEAAKHKIARFIENLDLTAIILDEQSSRGQTIIDKFEEYADEAGFAIVLLTADDVGAPKDKTEALKPRARQNVILELGYFLRGLGRDRVRILYEENVELPSDIYGISYVQMDKRGAWKMELAQEIASVGITVDMNKLLRGG